MCQQNYDCWCDNIQNLFRQVFEILCFGLCWWERDHLERKHLFTSFFPLPSPLTLCFLSTHFGTGSDNVEIAFSKKGQFPRKIYGRNSFSFWDKKGGQQFRNAPHSRHWLRAVYSEVILSTNLNKWCLFVIFACSGDLHEIFTFCPQQKTVMLSANQAWSKIPWL